MLYECIKYQALYSYKNEQLTVFMPSSIVYENIPFVTSHYIASCKVFLHSK